MIRALLTALRWSPASLRAQSWWKRWRRRRRARTAQPGRCPICAGPARFFPIAGGPRETPMCAGCGSVARQRALVHTLAGLGLDLTTARVHESSPSLATYEFFAARCREFIASYHLPDRPAGARLGAFTVADLTALPFAADTFDLVVTLDVLEHVPTPARALLEIARTLRAGGTFVFTVPRDPARATRARAELTTNGWRHLQPAQFHADPTTRRGALVVTDWGHDLEARLADAGLTCRTLTLLAPEIGVPVPIEVFVARKPATAGDSPPATR